MDEHLVKSYRGLVCEPRRHKHPVTRNAIIECCTAFLAESEATA